jgi:hypothetical protein
MDHSHPLTLRAVFMRIKRRETSEIETLPRQTKNKNERSKHTYEISHHSSCNWKESCTPPLRRLGLTQPHADLVSHFAR